MKDNSDSKIDNRSNQNDVLAKRLIDKISEINKQIIFPAKEVDTTIATDLAEIYVALEKYREAIDKFLAANIQNRDAMEEALVEVETNLRYIESHIKNAHSLFEEMKTYYCWK